jgi:peptidoglycan/LPS O-acetylase OafA/YrhL
LEARFRTDIEGLRAVAILPILLFHLDPALCPGGFVGVDIFFVISGYLISRMILEQGTRFRFASFYLNRTLRLIPALVATLICTLIAAWRLLSPDQYAGLARSALTAVFAVSNIYFYAITDYFAGEATEYPLLHTWSLGVEEQFYLLWPALLLVISRRAGMFKIIAAAAILSFAAAILYARHDPEFAFYMMPFRIFEFAGGAALAAYRKPVRLGGFARGLLGSAAVVMLAASFALFDDSTPWPSAFTLVPAVATVILIAAGSNGIWHKALSLPPLRFLGRISYSLYLVHWPVISLMRSRIVVEPTPTELAFAGLASIVLATLLHVAIEQPFRLRHARQGESTQSAFPRLRLSLACAGLIGTIVFAGSIVASMGFPSRIKTTQGATETLTFAGDLCDAKKSRCAFGDLAATDNVIYLVGDSHALNLLYGLNGLFQANRIKGIALFDHGCLFIKGTTRYLRGQRDEKCARTIAETFQLLSENKRPIIYAGRYKGYMNRIGPADGAQPLQQTDEDYYRWLDENLGATLESLGPKTRPVIVVAEGYDTGIDLQKCLAQPITQAAQSPDRCRPASAAEAIATAKPADDVIERIRRRHPDLTVIDPKIAFCESGTCATRDGNDLYYRDTQHLTNKGSEFLIGKIAPRLLPLLTTAK